MSEQRVVVSLFANNASYLSNMTAATGATDKLRVSVDGLGRQMAGVAAGADGAAAGTARLGEGAAVASTQVGRLGKSSAAARGELTLLGTGGELAGGKLSKAMSLAAKTIPLVTVVAAAEFTKMAGEFQQKTNVLVTAAGESQSALAGVRKGILDIATSTGTKWQDVTDGMYQIEKAGYRGADGLKILKAAAQGAREEGANLATVTAATTSVMASYHIGADGAVGVTNQIKTAAGEAKTTMETFAGSLSTVLPLASANKVSFADVAGSLASLTQHGTTADQGAQELAFTMRNLAAPSNVAVQAMGQLGISSTDVSQKLGDGPGGRGLAGTLKYLSQTILTQMGPDGLVLLDTFKKSTTAGDDMQRMLAAMPPAVKDLSEKFSSGAITLAEYRTGLKALPADQANLAQQYVVLSNRSTGFNDALKRGGPAAATYSAELKAMTGGADGLNASLQLTGASMDGTDARIGRVADAAKGAGTDVQGWASTQDLFNVKLDRFRQTADAVAINLGTKLLPAVSATFGYFADHAQVLEVAAVGLGAIGLALTGIAIKAGVSDAATTLWGAATGAANAIASTTLGTYTGVLGLEAGAALRAAAANDTMTGSLLRGAASTGAAAGGLAKLAGTAGAAVGLLHELDVHANGLIFPTDKASTSVNDLTKSLQAAGSGNAAPAVIKNIDALGKSMQFYQKSLINAQVNPFSGSFWSLHGGANQINDATGQINNLDKALTGLVASGQGQQASAAFDQIAAAAKRQGVSLSDVQKSLPGYEAAVKTAGAGAKTAATDTDLLTTAQGNLAGAQKTLNDALQTSIDKFTILNTGALSQERANEALVGKTDALTAAVKANGATLDITTTAGVANRQAVVDLITASNDKITADFKANESTKGVGAAMDTASQQILANRDTLIKQMVQAGFTQDAAKQMADQFLLTPAQVATQFNTPGLLDAQNGVNTLQANIQALRDKTITIDANVGVTGFVAPGVGASSLASKLSAGNKATGGPIHGPGTGTSDTAGLFRLSNGEHVWTAAEVAKAGGHSAVESMRSAVLGMATGGPVVTGDFSRFNVAPLTAGVTADMTAIYGAAQKQAQTNALASQASASYGGAPGAAGGAAQWASVILAALGMLGQPATMLAGVESLINSESGGNPNAINLTDSNAKAGHPSRGLMQTIPGTFEAYRSRALPDNIVDPLANIYAGIHYALVNYGPAMLMAGGRHTASGGYLGYDQGGIANGVGYMPKNIIAPERVLDPHTTKAFDQLVQLLDRSPEPRTWMRPPQGGGGAAGGSAGAAPSGGQFTGTLVLDSGELLGVVHGAIDQAAHTEARFAGYSHA